MITHAPPKSLIALILLLVLSVGGLLFVQQDHAYAQDAVVTAMSPTTGEAHETTSVTIQGNGFTLNPPPAVRLSGTAGIFDLSNAVAQSSTSLTAVIPAGLQAGIYDLIVVSNGQMGILHSAFIVLLPTDSTATPSPTPSATALPPVATATATATRVPPTSTATATATRVPPTATRVPPTATRVPPTATRVPPTATATTIPPTATPVTYAVSGRVSDSSGAGLAGVVVSAGARAATSDTSGNYRISGLAAGSYRLTASLSGYSLSPSSRSVSVSGPVSGQDFVATPLNTSAAFDLTVSLYHNPVGTQRTAYEEMLRYFADGVFEMSNGVHKLGTVTIYPNDGRSGRADVQWVETCWPKAHLAGYGSDGLRIEMCDRFSGVNFLQAHEDGGYVLAHEWGHYFYALYDEYRSTVEYDRSWPHMPRTDDTPVPESIMNSQWQATGGHFAWLNFSTALNNTRNTAQQRIYQASGWETLVRSPELDPRDGILRNYPSRPYFPALVAVAPAAGQAPRIDLVAGHSARSELNIVWAPSSATLRDANNEFVASLNLLDGGIITYPQPIRLLAALQRAQPIAGALAEGELLAPDGTRTTFTLRDDGLAPDPEADDGLYSALVNYRQDGPHTLRVRFSNPDGTAREIFDSGQFAPPPPGMDPPQLPAPQPIGADFAVEAEVELMVTGTQADDHGDTPQTATLLPSSNRDLAGKIDRPGDRDLFRITVEQSGRLVVRVSDMGFGMHPRLRLLAADGSSERANLLWSGAGPLWAEVVVQAGDLIYAEVSHQDPNEAGGIYKISAGPAIVSEQAAHYGVYLPLVRR